MRIYRPVTRFKPDDQRKCQELTRHKVWSHSTGNKKIYYRTIKLSVTPVNLLAVQKAR
jgi:hypothetical protein